MGQRFRLRADFDISDFDPTMQISTRPKKFLMFRRGDSVLRPIIKN
ncbi:MAG: hypothetical protein Q9P01_05350 [Anaerolineae bacterium]|nr:hypothetical protein [Anaerolineae bacterium]MDQ7034264.1 hypothetical protein [Anaerolineae bacterium]